MSEEGPIQVKLVYLILFISIASRVGISGDVAGGNARTG